MQTYSRRWHRRDMPLGRNHSRYTLSYRDLGLAMSIATGRDMEVTIATALANAIAISILDEELTIFCRSPRSILSSLRFNRDSLSGTDGLTQLTSYIISLTLLHCRFNSPIHRSSPLGYRRKACSPLNRGDRGPFSNGYMMVYGGLKNCSSTIHIPECQYSYSQPPSLLDGSSGQRTPDNFCKEEQLTSFV